MLHQALARPLAVPTGKAPLSELYADLCADYLGKGQRLADLTKRWQHLEKVFGGDQVETITTERIRRYVDARLAAQASVATVALEVACLRRMMRLGFNATPRKVTELPIFPTLRVSNTRIGFFEREAFVAVRKRLPRHLQPLVTVAYWTGMRRGELLALQWRQVDLERGTVRLDPGTTKNREGRLIFLPPEALRVLQAWRRETVAFERQQAAVVPHVFHRDGQPIGFDFYAPWRAACAAAGYPGRLFHDFRRTAARNYTRTGISERVTMQILGHKTRSIFDRYNIVSESDLADAAARIAAHKPPTSRSKVLRVGAGPTRRKG